MCSYVHMDAAVPNTIYKRLETSQSENSLWNLSAKTPSMKPNRRNIMSNFWFADLSDLNKLHRVGWINYCRCCLKLSIFSGVQSCYLSASCINHCVVCIGNHLIEACIELRKRNGYKLCSPTTNWQKHHLNVWANNRTTGIKNYCFWQTIFNCILMIDHNSFCINVNDALIRYKGAADLAFCFLIRVLFNLRKN